MADILMTPPLAPVMSVHPNCRMIEKAGPTAIGANQVTELIATADNAYGLILHTFYTQVIQTGSPGNLAQSLIVAAASAPTDFTSKTNCLPIYRTFQSDKQDAIAAGGFAPMNFVNIHIPANWGMWQLANVVGSALDRNNMRLGVVFLTREEARRMRVITSTLNRS